MSWLQAALGVYTQHRARQRTSLDNRHPLKEPDIQIQRPMAWCGTPGLLVFVKVLAELPVLVCSLHSQNTNLGNGAQECWSQEAD